MTTNRESFKRGLDKFIEVIHGCLLAIAPFLHIQGGTPPQFYCQENIKQLLNNKPLNPQIMFGGDKWLKATGLERSVEDGTLLASKGTEYRPGMMACAP